MLIPLDVEEVLAHHNLQVPLLVTVYCQHLILTLHSFIIDSETCRGMNYKKNYNDYLQGNSAVSLTIYLPKDQVE